MFLTMMLLEVCLRLPDWVPSEIGPPASRFGSDAEKMDLAIRLAERNVAEGTGGPFGAAVFDAGSGMLVAAGVNIVVPARCSVGHAEAVAIMIAQQTVGIFDLGAQGLPQLELVTSAEPCIQCFGVIWWSGLRRVVTGATGSDVHTSTGFEEGPLPSDWTALLAHRPPLPPVDVVTGCLRSRACEVLRKYRDGSGPIYHPGSGKKSYRAP